jgi:hypothetical protein
MFLSLSPLNGSSSFILKLHFDHVWFVVVSIRVRALCVQMKWKYTHTSRQHSDVCVCLLKTEKLREEREKTTQAAKCNTGVTYTIRYLYALWVIILNDRRRHKRHANGPPTESSPPVHNSHDTMFSYLLLSFFPFLPLVLYTGEKRRGGLSFLSIVMKIVFCFLVVVVNFVLLYRLVDQIYSKSHTVWSYSPPLFFLSTSVSCLRDTGVVRVIQQISCEWRGAAYIFFVAYIIYKTSRNVSDTCFSQKSPDRHCGTLLFLLWKFRGI